MSKIQIRSPLKIVICAICMIVSVLIIIIGLRRIDSLYPKKYNLSELSSVEATVIDSEYVHLTTSKWPYIFILDNGTELYIPSRMIANHFDFAEFEEKNHNQAVIYYDTNNSKSIEYNGSIIEAHRAISITENDYTWVTVSDNEFVNKSYRAGELGGLIACALSISFVGVLFLLTPEKQNTKTKKNKKG